MRFGTYQEVGAFASAGAVAVVPLGCTEQQGPHLPVDFDSWFAEALVAAQLARPRKSMACASLFCPYYRSGRLPSTAV